MKMGMKIAFPLVIVITFAAFVAFVDLVIPKHEPVSRLAIHCLYHYSGSKHDVPVFFLCFFSSYVTRMNPYLCGNAGKEWRDN